MADNRKAKMCLLRWKVWCVWQVLQHTMNTANAVKALANPCLPQHVMDMFMKQLEVPAPLPPPPRAAPQPPRPQPPPSAPSTRQSDVVTNQSIMILLFTLKFWARHDDGSFVSIAVTAAQVQHIVRNGHCLSRNLHSSRDL